MYSWECITGDLFRTDAKCESGRVTHGGYHLTGGQWFSLSVGPHEAPYLVIRSGHLHHQNFSL